MRHVAHLSLALALFSAVSLAARPARACSGTCAFDAFSVSATAPANGVIVATYTCLWGSICTPPEGLTVTDAHTGDAVEGTLERELWQPITRYHSGGARYVFLPDQPLTPQQLYRVVLDENERSRRVDREHFVTASAAAADEPLGLTLEVTYYVLEHPLDAETCCPDPNDRTECHALVRQRVLAPIVILMGPNAEQWAVELRLLSTEGEAVTDFFRAGYTDDVITTTLPEYCFEVRMESFATGEVASMPMQCVPGDGSELVRIEEEECVSEAVLPGSVPMTSESSSSVEEQAREQNGCTALPASPARSGVAPLLVVLGIACLRLRRRSARR